LRENHGTQGVIHQIYWCRPTFEQAKEVKVIQSLLGVLVIACLVAWIAPWVYPGQLHCVLLCGAEVILESH